MKYKKYYRKTSLKQKGGGAVFLNEVKVKSPIDVLEIYVFLSFNARYVCD